MHNIQKCALHMQWLDKRNHQTTAHEPAMFRCTHHTPNREYRTSEHSESVVAMYTQNLNSNPTYKLCNLCFCFNLDGPKNVGSNFWHTNTNNPCIHTNTFIVSAMCMSGVVYIVFAVHTNSSFSATSHIFWLWCAFDWQTENGTTKQQQHSQSA